MRKGFLKLSPEQGVKRTRGKPVEQDVLTFGQSQFIENLQEKIYNRREEEGFDAIQGRAVCPVCNGIVEYTWTRAAGFIVMECADNDCLPWPQGGARARRENGQPKIVPTRYRRGK